MAWPFSPCRPALREPRRCAHSASRIRSRGRSGPCCRSSRSFPRLASPRRKRPPPPRIDREPRNPAPGGSPFTGYGVVAPAERRRKPALPDGASGRRGFLPESRAHEQALDRAELGSTVIELLPERVELAEEVRNLRLPASPIGPSPPRPAAPRTGIRPRRVPPCSRAVGRGLQAKHSRLELAHPQRQRVETFGSGIPSPAKRGRAEEELPGPRRRRSGSLSDRDAPVQAGSRTRRKRVSLRRRRRRRAAAPTVQPYALPGSGAQPGYEYDLHRPRLGSVLSEPS